MLLGRPKDKVLPWWYPLDTPVAWYPMPLLFHNSLTGLSWGFKSLCPPPCSHLHGSPPPTGAPSVPGFSLTYATSFLAPSASGCFYKPNPVGEDKDLSI